ncbi:DUF2768 domain-containing protein [Oceanobacillus luteolus]|uniref:DUF2768 domain-containing protein n=1 Tax=Oceanobacillus luteolus TaxID=1274358 RepID=A0ABW4HS57_9BACI|nr:DUF2768 domain-containing protein [Oceanobacillus luteolus]MCM3738853.1 DUF2768 domain-containing protein [Oceanobacillus luteolus]
MSISMLKMYISFVGMILLFIALGLIWLSRKKLTGWLANVISLLAYFSLVSGAIIILFVVFTGPTR